MEFGGMAILLPKRRSSDMLNSSEKNGTAKEQSGVYRAARLLRAERKELEWKCEGRTRVIFGKRLIT